MGFDQTKIGQLTASLMEQLDEQYDEECGFGDVLLLAEVVGPHGSSVHFHGSNPSAHVNLGLVRFADKSIRPDVQT
jgi:hypothetical protein